MHVYTVNSPRGIVKHLLYKFDKKYERIFYMLQMNEVGLDTYLQRTRTLSKGMTHYYYDHHHIFLFLFKVLLVRRNNTISTFLFSFLHDCIHITYTHQHYRNSHFFFFILIRRLHKVIYLRLILLFFVNLAHHSLKANIT